RVVDDVVDDGASVVDEVDDVDDEPDDGVLDVVVDTLSVLDGVALFASADALPLSPGPTVTTSLARTSDSSPISTFTWPSLSGPLNPEPDSSRSRCLMSARR